MKTFEELAEDAAGTIYVDAYENDVRYLIMRGGASLCAYLGVPKDHPLWGFDYESLPLSVSGGLTFAGEGTTKNLWPESWYWYGWDYAHCDDKSFYDLDRRFKPFKEDLKAWTVEDVQKEIWSATYDFSKLMKLGACIAAQIAKDAAEITKEDK